MTTTLFDMFLAVARYCLPSHSGISTAAGDATTLVDGTRKQANDQFNSGALCFLSGTYARTYVAITDYANDTGTFTFGALAGAPGSGVLYEAFALKSGMNMYDIISSINQALPEILTEDTTLTTIDGWESYDLPTGVRNVKLVEVARSTSLPYKWRPNPFFKEINADLRIPNQYAYFGDSYLIRLTYLGRHATLTASTSTVDPQVNVDWLRYAAAIELIRKLANRGVSWDSLKVIYDEAQQKVTSMRPRYESIVTVKA